MKLPPLDYIQPGTVTEALKVWSDREVMFLAGGQGLLSEMGQGLRLACHAGRYLGDPGTRGHRDHG